MGSGVVLVGGDVLVCGVILSGGDVLVGGDNFGGGDVLGGGDILGSGVILDGGDVLAGGKWRRQRWCKYFQYVERKLNSKDFFRPLVLLLLFKNQLSTKNFLLYFLNILKIKRHGLTLLKTELNCIF